MTTPIITEEDNVKVARIGDITLKSTDKIVIAYIKPNHMLDTAEIEKYTLSGEYKNDIMYVDTTRADIVTYIADKFESDYDIPWTKEHPFVEYIRVYENENTMLTMCVNHKAPNVPILVNCLATMFYPGSLMVYGRVAITKQVKIGDKFWQFDVTKEDIDRLLTSFFNMVITHNNELVTVPNSTLFLKHLEFEPETTSVFMTDYSVIFFKTNRRELAIDNIKNINELQEVLAETEYLWKDANHCIVETRPVQFIHNRAGMIVKIIGLIMENTDIAGIWQSAIQDSI